MRMNKERMYKTSYSISARSRNRTGTGELPQQDFKSCASTNSAIRAEEKERTKNLNQYKARCVPPACSRQALAGSTNSACLYGHPGRRKRKNKKLNNTKHTVSPLPPP